MSEEIVVASISDLADHPGVTEELKPDNLAPSAPSSAAPSSAATTHVNGDGLPSPDACSSVGRASSITTPSTQSMASFSSRGERVSFSRLKYIKSPDLLHLRLMTRFLDLCGLTDDVAGTTTKLLLKCIDMLYRCKYSTLDLCSVLAHASAYFQDAYGLCGNNMDSSEVGNVLVLIIYIAHCYVQDETCPLKVWHKYLFKKYCSVDTLDAAIIRIMEIRGFVLRVPDEDFQRAFAYLSTKPDQSSKDNAQDAHTGVKSQ